MQDALLEVAFHPVVVVINHLGLAVELIPLIVANDHPQLVPKSLDAALALPQAGLESARDEVAVLKLDDAFALEEAVLVPAAFERVDFFLDVWKWLDRGTSVVDLIVVNAHFDITKVFQSLTRLSAETTVIQPCYTDC